MRKSVIALALALASIGAGSESCGNAGVDEDQYVRDVWLPGHYPGYDQWYCTDKTKWLLKIQWSPSGRITSRCVSESVGKKQKIGTLYQP